MTAKIVCRLLDAQNQLLGWTEHHALVRGDGCLRALHFLSIPVTAQGVATCVSLHWADVNVETRIPIPAELALVSPGLEVPLFVADQPMVVLGTPPVNLPHVTVGEPVRVGVPAGQMGTRSS